MSFDAFSPTGANIVLAASGTTAGAVLPGVDGQQILVTNNSALGMAFIALGFGSTPTATTADGRSVASANSRIFSIPIGVTHVAVILDTSTGNVAIQRGYGQ